MIYKIIYSGIAFVDAQNCEEAQQKFDADDLKFEDKTTLSVERSEEFEDLTTDSFKLHENEP